MTDQTDQDLKGQDMPTQNVPQAMIEEDDMTLEQVYRRAGLHMLKWFDEAEPDERSDRRADMAIKIIGAYTRKQATDNNRDALRFQVARSLASSPNELREYVRIALPDHGTVRALQAPKGGEGEKNGNA